MKLFLKLFILLILAALAAGLAAYGVARSNSKELNQAVRDAIGGNYIQTDHGIISFTRQGSTDAPTVILVHGLSTPKFVWEQVTPSILAAGYQVITFDHLGRGFSDRPKGPYDSALYQSELSGLITGLALSTPLRLVGYSMGGANVVYYAASNPTQIKKLVLIAPVGYLDNDGSRPLFIAPIIGEWVFTMFGKQAMRGSIEAEVDSGSAPADMLEKFEQQVAYKGSTDAILSTMRHLPMADLAHRYRLVADAGIPVSVIWGTADKVVPYAGAARMAEDLPQLKLITIEGANHSMTYGRADEVASALVNALND